MKKTSLLKKGFALIAVACLSASTLFTSCVNYDNDILNLQDQINELNDVITALKTQVDNLNTVSSVTPISGGFRVVFSNNQSYDVVKGTDGATGAAGTSWEIGSNGNWFKNGEDTRVKAVAIDGANGKNAPSPTISTTTGNWVVYEWDDSTNDYKERDTGVKAEGQDGLNGGDGSTWTIGADGYWYKDNEKTTYKATGVPAPAPEISSTGYWIIYKWDATAEDYLPETTTIKAAGNFIPAPAPFIKDSVWHFVEWNETTQKYDSIKSNPEIRAIIDLPYVVKYSDHYMLYIRTKLADGTLVAEFEGIKLPIFGTTAQTAQINVDFLGFVNGFNPSNNLGLGDILDLDITFNKITGKPITNGYGTGDTLWTAGVYGGMKTVAVNATMSSLGSGTYAVIRLDGYDPTTLTGTDISLQNSKGTKLPLSYAAPIKYENLLTKAESVGSLYLIPITGVNAGANVNNFATNALYRLVFTLPTGTAKSNYANTTIIYQQATLPMSKENAQSLIRSGGASTITPAGGGNNAKADVYSGVKYTISFNSNVYDYYVEGTGSFTTDKSTGTFSVTSNSTITVYKLHLDGNIYKEDIDLTAIQL